MDIGAEKEIKQIAGRKTAIIFDERVQLHRSPFGHPESPQRLDVFLRELKANPFLAKIPIVQPSPASRETILLAHSEEHYEYAASSVSEGGLKYLDAAGETYVMGDSLQAGLLGAGSVIKAVELVLNGKYENLFCLVRPPGHHAGTSTAMGFCLFNNIAIGAQYSINKFGLERVAIVDWDVHHGNGTEEIFYRTPKVLYISLHQYPYFPGTGPAEETGEGEGKGYTINFPLPAGTGGDVYRKIFENEILQALESYNPQLLMISAGFDAHKDDPLADMNLTEDDFSFMTGVLQDYSIRNNIGIISVLEGGYNPEVLSGSITAHLKGRD